MIMMNKGTDFSQKERIDEEKKVNNQDVLNLDKNHLSPFTEEDVDDHFLLHTPYVYHYTSFETLFALLESSKKYKAYGKCLHFRASNIYKMNDPKEMEAGFEAVKQLLRKYESERSIPKGMRLSEIYNDEVNENACKEDYMKGKEKYAIVCGHIPFSISFSARGDYLPMWSLYGQNMKGVCLKFNTSELQEHVSTLGSDYTLEKVVYSVEKGTRTLESLIEFSYDTHLDGKRSEPKSMIDDKIGELADLCLIVSPFYKYLDYEYEQEVRLAYTKCYPTKCDFNNPFMGLEHHVIEPFVKIPIPVNCLKEIIIGPDANYEVMKHILELELENCGINPSIVKQSRIAYRSK